MDRDGAVGELEKRDDEAEGNEASVLRTSLRVITEPNTDKMEDTGGPIKVHEFHKRPVADLHHAADES